MTLRGYQRRDLERIRGAYQSGHRRVLYTLPTGGGKTKIFSEAIRLTCAMGGDAWVLVHRRELVVQAARSLQHCGLTPGVIAAGHEPRPNAQVQVASVQTLVRRLGTRHPPRLVVIDEAHHAVSSAWSRIIDWCEGSWLLGVTATPERLDGRGLAEHFSHLIEGPSVSELTNLGHLARSRVFAPPGPGVEGIKTRNGDYAREDVAARFGEKSIMGDVASHYKRYIGPAPAVAFCATVAHAESVAQELAQRGLKTATLSGKTPGPERDSILRDLGMGRIDVLTSCDVISEGTDIPAVGGAILLRPTQSLGLYLQQVGRCLRPSPGKTHAVVLDHVGNSSRHGLPDEPREWSLSSGKRSLRQSITLPPVTCLSCYGQIRRPAPDTCPWCEERLELSKKASRTPKEIEGELVEAKARMMRERKKAQSAAKTKEELIALAFSRGYINPHAWATYIINARNSKPGFRMAK